MFHQRSRIYFSSLKVIKIFRVPEIFLIKCWNFSFSLWVLVQNPDFLHLSFRGLSNLGHEGLCSGQAPMGKLSIHGYTKLCKNGRLMKFPSPDLIPNKWVCSGTNLYWEIISASYTEPSIGHGVAGLQTCLFHFSLLRLAWQQDWCDAKRLLHPSAPATLNVTKCDKDYFFSTILDQSLHASGTSWGPQWVTLWCLPVSFEQDRKQRKMFYLCCRSYKGSSFHICHGALLVMIDLVLPLSRGTILVGQDL